jgi:DNA-binding transcriptional regulator YdaS (Cro superfamily)
MDIKDIVSKAGGAAALARALGITHPSVCGWECVPAKRVPAVSALTGIPRHEIRPDLYEAPQEAA